MAFVLRVLLGLALCATVAHAADVATPAATESTGGARQVMRPRVGLVLSGGGARGLAHVGVLKVLEDLRVPIDVIAGTSMGAIVGGLYASGMRANDLERELIAIRWDQVFSSRVERQQLSQRRKEEDFDVSTAIELGLRDGTLRVQQSAVSSRGLESLLRRLTLPVRDITRFDALPIPFRAVATNMETGQAVVLNHGDLALALRSSMSVPGVFAPIEVDGLMLGDGGLVDNLPVEVARRLGVDRLIVVNIGTPLAGREALGSVLGQTQQMINILTEQNVQRSLATLQPDDVLIAPQLGALSASDFDRAPDFVALGVSGARDARGRLAALSIEASAYDSWRRAHAVHPPPASPLVSVEMTGTVTTNPQRLAAMLESRVGEPFDAARAERDTRRLAAAGDYVRTDYQLVRTDRGDGLVFELEDKPWGPDYLRLGIDLSTDFNGRSAFNVKLSHNRHWLTPNGTEWRNRLQIGEEPLIYTEIYHPLAWTSSLANDWFVSGYAGVRRRPLIRYAGDSGEELAEFKRAFLEVGFDVGQPWGEFGEFRFGPSHVTVHTQPVLLGSAYTGPTGNSRWTEDGVRARVVIDQLDFANFPLSGYRFDGQVWAGRRAGDLSGSFNRLEAQGTWVVTRGAHTFNAHARTAIANVGRTGEVGRYSLGGFHQLSGYYPGQLEGNDLLLLRLGWYMRQNQTPALTRGFFFGGTIEAGNVWLQRSEMRLSDLRSGMSLYLGADTGLGPMYLGLTYAPKGTTGLVLFIGRP